MKKIPTLLFILSIILSSWQSNAQITNDECVDAILLSVNTDLNCNTVTNGTIEGATDSGVNICGGTEDDDVWYKFVATQTTHTISLINVTGSTTDLYHAVYEEACGSLTAAIECSDPNFSTITNLTVGNTYLLQVYSWTATAGQNSVFDICIGSIPPPPANDECGSAISLTVNSDSSCGNTTIGTIAGATDSGVDFCTGREDDDVWFSFIASAPIHEISLLNIVGPETDLVHAVYNNNCGTFTNALNCSDPDNSTISGLTVGETYFIQVYTRTSVTAQSTQFDVCINTPIQPPLNDTCNNAISLTVNQNQECISIYSADHTLATSSGTAYSCDSVGSNIDTFYTFIAPAEGYIAVDIIAGTQTGIAEMALFDMCDGTELFCSRDNFQTFTGLTPGAEYTLAIWYDDPFDEGTFDICLSIPEIPNCVVNVMPIDGTTNTEKEVTFSWDFDTTASTPTSYEIFTGTDPGTLTSATTTTSTNIDLQFEFSTTYFYQIVPSNIAGSATGCSIQSFTVKDGPVPPQGLDCTPGNQPTSKFTEDFADATGWTGELNGGNGTWIFGNTGGTPSSPTGASNPQDAGGSYMFYEASSAGAKTTSIVSPVIDLSNIDISESAELSFYMHAFGEGIGTISISASSTASGPFTEIFNFVGPTQNASTDDWIQIGADISAFTGGELYVQISNISTGNFRGDVSIDTMEILACEAIPECTSNTTWDGGSWSNGTPDNTFLAIIDAPYETEINGNIDACAITITTNGNVTVSAESFIMAQNNIINEGSLTIQHTGSVVQINNNALMSNSGDLSVLLDLPTVAARDFLLIGSPTNATSREDLSGFRMLEHDTNEFDPYTAMPVTGVNFNDANLNDWTSKTGLLTVTEGYYYIPGPDLQTGGDYSLDYNTGDLNNGVFVYPTIFGDDKEDSPNILANPYPSAIDTDALIQTNDAIDEIYFWEHNTTPAPSFPGANSANYNMQDISIRNDGMGVAASTGGTAPTQFMSTGQGFGIKASTADEITFSNALRVTNNNDQLRTNISDRLWLNLISDDYNLASNMGILFNDEATEGYESKYDSKRLATPIVLYSTIEGKDDGYAIQGREEFNSGVSVGVGFSTLVEDDNASYTIKMANRDGDNMLVASIYLIDNTLNTATDLTQGSYTFTSEFGDYSDRFTLVFENDTLNINEVNLENITIFPNPANNKLNVSSLNAEILSFTIRDIRGRVFVSKTVNANKLSDIDLEKLNSGVYLITINTIDGLITKRFIKE